MSLEVKKLTERLSTPVKEFSDNWNKENIA